MEPLTLKLMPFDCGTKLAVAVGRGDWAITQALSVDKPLPPKFADDPEIVAAFEALKQKRAEVLRLHPEFAA